MEKDQMNRTIATKILGWKPTKWQNHFINEKGDSVDVRNTFTDDIKYAWIIVEKLGLAVIPQSKESGFNWHVCDVESVSYRGEEIAITPLDDTSYSSETIAMAICLSALLSIGIDV